MHPLNEIIQNPLTRERNQCDRAQLLVLFPELSSCSDGHYLALRCYFQNCPERFFDRRAYKFFFEWLKNRAYNDASNLKKYFDEYGSEINQALLFLREINLEPWHDELPKKEDELDLIRFIDKHIHPTYLRLAEAVFAPLVRIVAYFSRLDRGKGTEGLDIWSIVQELSKSCPSEIVASYRHIVRNGIAHGGITYLQYEIRYRDKRGNKEKIDASNIVRLCDDLLDICNGIAAALKVFLIVKKTCLLQEVLLEELQEETHSPWWRISGCVESENNSRKQLLIYAKPNSLDYSKIRSATIQAGILAEFFAPGYDRYFFSLRSPKGLPGWAGFDGHKLAALRSAGISDINQYQGILENNLVYYVPKLTLPRCLAKADTLLQSFRLIWPQIMAQMRKESKIPEIICRNASIHGNSWGSVVNASVVIDCLEDNEAMDVVRTWKRRIIKTGLKAARKKVGFFTFARYLPLGFARVSIFRKDNRRRRLANSGLMADLVCTLQLQKIRRIQCPDILGSTIEKTGKWRIAWNRTWLEDSDQQRIAKEGL